MGLRIRTNLASEAVRRNLNQSERRSEQQLSRLSSGKRITKASDDAAGLAIAKRLEGQVRSLRQAKRNANDGVSMVQTTEGGLNEISNILVRLRELSIQSASDTISNVERGYLNEEFGQLTNEVDRIAQSTTYGNMKLLNGDSEGELAFHVGSGADENNVIRFDTDQTDVTAGTLGISGLNVEERSDATSALEDIDDAMSKVSGLRAGLGAVQSRLHSTISNLETQSLNLESARSRIEDTDYAEATASLTQEAIIKSAGIATLAQANNIQAQTVKLIG